MDTNGMATFQVPLTMIQQASTQGAQVTSGESQQSVIQPNEQRNPMGGRNEQAQLRSRNGNS